jgi:hypothetical protein
MANWCSNTLVVTGPGEDLERFQEKADFPISSCEVSMMRVGNWRSGFAMWPRFKNTWAAAVWSHPRAQI